jgi:hypothetical protein
LIFKSSYELRSWYSGQSAVTYFKDLQQAKYYLKSQLRNSYKFWFFALSGFCLIRVLRRVRSVA